MRYSILGLLVTITLFPSFKYWEDYSRWEQKQIANSLDKTNPVSHYLSNPWLPEDDENTYHLLDVLTSGAGSNRGLEALYFHIFNIICLRADGALAEGMGEYCYKVFFSNPDYVFHYVLLQESLKGCYVTFLGGYFSMAPDLYPSFCDMLDSKLTEKGNIKQKPRFLESIREVISRYEE